VSRRLQAALEDLLTVVPPDRRAALEHQTDLLSSSTTASMKDPRDANMALNGDRQGLGVAAGFTAIGPTASAVTLPSP
jgi:hypothetical protein